MGGFFGPCIDLRQPSEDRDESPKGGGAIRAMRRCGEGFTSLSYILALRLNRLRPFHNHEKMADIPDLASTSCTRYPAIRVGLVLALGTSSCLLQACAFHYFDPVTGVEHLIGFGHLVMKTTVNEDCTEAVLLGRDLLGFSAGRDEEGVQLALGWSRSRRVRVLDEDGLLLVEWPNADLVNARIGTALPSEQKRQDRSCERL